MIYNQNVDNCSYDFVNSYKKDMIDAVW